jgi:hypothetical protein
MFAHSVFKMFPSITRVNLSKYFQQHAHTSLSRDIGSGISSIMTSRVTLYDIKYVND